MQFVALGDGDYLNLATVVRAEFSDDGDVVGVTTTAPDYDTLSDEVHPVVVPHHITLCDDKARILRYAIDRLAATLPE